MSRRQALAGALLACAALGALWQASPWLLWKLRFEGQLAALAGAERLRSDAWTNLPRPARGWPTLVSGAVSLRAPLAREALPACGRCATQCRLPLDNRGTLGIFDDPSLETYGEALDDFAPDARDITPWRSVVRNWKTIDALTERARATTPPPQRFRFESPGSRGIVTRFRVDDVPRYVIYAYAHDGTAARVIGVAGLEEARFAGVLGGLVVDPAHAERESRCEP